MRNAATEELLREEDPRIRVVRVAGASSRIDALQDDALVSEPDNEHDPNAIGIWDEERRAQAGYVPADVARDLDPAEWQAVSVREFFEDGKRLGLRVLLAPLDAWIGVPRT